MPPTVRRSPAAPVRRPAPTPAADAVDPATGLTAAQLHILGQVYDLILAHARAEATASTNSAAAGANGQGPGQA